MKIFLENHWLLLGLAALALLWGGSLVLVRCWTRRRLLRVLALTPDAGVEANLALPDSRPEDRAALDLIRKYRRRGLVNLWPGTDFSFRAINEMSLELIRGIAQVYYPQEDRPELKASLADLVALHNRVGARLAGWLETFPIRPFKDVELGTIVRAHELYQTVTSHPTYAFMKRYHLHRVARWGLTIYNYANPWHWGGRAAYHGGKELAARLLLARIADLVGEEAVLLYGRQPGKVAE
jgi:hypothetical protein